MRPAAHLILTVDYELFGDGSGDTDCCVVNPSEKILEISGEFSAPVTFFVEALEFLHLGRVPANRARMDRVSAQLISAVKNGHDAQLHLHPQWHDADVTNSLEPKLDLARWRVGDLDEIEVNRIFDEGSAWLRDLLRPIDENYCCNVFRAGGWCIQPSATVVGAMLRQGIDMDTTVAPGYRNTTKGEWSDFRHAPNAPFWHADADVCTASMNGILEVPIVTGGISRWRHLYALLQSRRAGHGGLAEGCHGSYQGPHGGADSIAGKIGKLLRLGHVMLDFSTMPVDVLIDVTEQWLAKHYGGAAPIPIVAIGHSKNFTPRSASALHAYLKWAAAEDIRFSTFGKWREAINE